MKISEGNSNLHKFKSTFCFRKETATRHKYELQKEIGTHGSFCTLYTLSTSPIVLFQTQNSNKTKSDWHHIL